MDYHHFERLSETFLSSTHSSSHRIPKNSRNHSQFLAFQKRGQVQFLLQCPPSTSDGSHEISSSSSSPTPSPSFFNLLFSTEVNFPSSQWKDSFRTRWRANSDCVFQIIWTLDGRADHGDQRSCWDPESWRVHQKSWHWLMGRWRSGVEGSFRLDWR